MVYKPPLSPGPFENWLSSSSSPPSSRSSFRSFVRSSRARCNAPPLPSPLLLSPSGAWAPLTRISAYNGTTSKRVSFLPSIERGKPRQGRILCLCARVYVCVCVGGGDHRWRRSMKSRSGIGEFCQECFSGIDRSKAVSDVSS